ncbi:DNA translocase FtsK [Paenibacillus albiflavus]|uniref:DNA translocase FtsK n=1 Tax=Paenibacillus albiflavus TaxID=2545760 RepID=A0A4R4EL18_9BACL|nr:DNA translocase FtsK [Paenibacillus albiflavus]TCZ80020.1 DNA translocase FtsK [Paenibacillus albiflavus]
MARKSKRGKKNAIKKNLMYELYGILILTFSVIALAGQGHVGRTLINLCFVFFGNPIGYVLPLVAIGIGLYIMIRRTSPQIVTMRNVGVFLFILCLAGFSHVSFYNEFPKEVFTSSGMIWSITWDEIMNAFTNSGTSNGLITGIGGGVVGATLFTITYFLFDVAGSKLVLVVMTIISVIMITGFSVVNAIERFNGKIKGKGRSKEKFAAWLRSMLVKPKSAKPALAQESKVSTYIEEDEEEEFVEEYTPPAKKPSWLQRLQADKSSKSAAPAPARSSYVQEAEDDEEEGLEELEMQQEEETPLIRSFQDHVLNSDDSEDSNDQIQPTPIANNSRSQQESDTDETGDLTLAGLEKQVNTVPYVIPSFSLLAKPQGSRPGEQADSKANAKKLEATLESFGVRAKVLEVVHGPAVTRYEIQPDVGVKVSRIVSLTDDIALALAAKDIRMEAPIPGKSAIGIEVPNMEVSIVTLREVMETSAFQDASSRLTVTLGRDISGQPIVGNLAKMPHLLVAGATGSGKSVCINGIITSILYKAKPNEVKFMMIDPKMVELNVYNGIPHLLAPVVTDPRRASLALKKIVSEMERRYELFSKSSTRNIEGYNALLTENGTEEPLPYIVVIVDELADLMMVAAHDVEDAICRLAQMARAAGIHLIIATQRPSVDVITGVIKANIPSRIAFGVSSQVDSRTILDMVGAEKLLGRGDMLYLPVGASKPIRVQGAFLSDHEVEAVVSFVSSQEKAEYQEEMVPEIEDTPDNVDEHEDELFDQAVQIVLEAKQASVSLLQRRMRIGYTRAARLIDYMESKGIIGPYEGSKPREVLMSMEQFNHSRIPS